MRILTILLFITFLASCSNNRKPADKQKIVTKDPNTFFVIEYHSNGAVREILITNKDSSQVVQTLFDSSGTLLFSGVTKNHIRTHGTEYYPNGRPMGLVNFDTSITGHATYYFDNGQKKSEGRWENAGRVGVWKEYNTSGKVIKIDTLN